ncbi:MAG: hypothetical protein ABIR53_05990 [Paraperlucidibaca sp.]
MQSLPSAEAIALTLSTLLRRKVQVTQASVPDRLPILGFYRSTADHDVAVCESDIAFAAHAAAAFALIPASIAQESVKAGVLDEGLQEIFAEVLNVLSRVFADTDGMRITLTSKVFPPSDIPAQMTKCPAGGEVGFEVSIDGYGKGFLGLGLLVAV